MNPIPFIPENAPFTPEQRSWLNGFLAGIFSNANPGMQSLPDAPNATSAAPAKPLTILFGSQTGTAEGLAKKTAKEAGTKGFAPKLVCMDQFESVDLSKEQHLLVITSTYGDGEPPDNAQAFWDFLKADAAPKLEHLHYSVLALGDTNYSGFCQFGKNCDERFEALGARRVHPRVDCDVDYEAPAKTWTEGVITAFSSNGFAQSRQDAKVAKPVDNPGPGAFAPLHEAYSKTNPFHAKLLTNRLLNGEGSDKEVRHYELSLAGSGLKYEVGDSLGVMPVNCDQLVTDVLNALLAGGDEMVKTPDGLDLTLREALSRHCDLRKPSAELLNAVASRIKSESELRPLLDPSRKEDLKNWLWGREVIDLITDLENPFTPAEFVALLKKLQWRLYSISSSPKAHPDEVHLTIAAVRYQTHGRYRKGVCSTLLADRCDVNTQLPVYVQTSHGFRLPADGNVPLIMCGPGTGIAPFRAFLEERQATGAKGRNWLFFGDQKRSTDFLYREQLEGWVADGHLARLDLAFSRDQAEKVYIQNRMLENAGELWNWLQEGAHFYVCGDASRMAKDVDAALHRIAESAGGLSPEAAAETIQKMKSAKRYQRDVY